MGDVTSVHVDCLLCTSPVPSTQEDANSAYLCGFADGVLYKARGERRAPLCGIHSSKLAEILGRYGLDLAGDKAVRGPIPAKHSIQGFIHCNKCLEQIPKGQSPAAWARFEVGFTEIGLQIRCARHKKNVMHIDFEGHRHAVNNEPDDPSLTLVQP